MTWRKRRMIMLATEPLRLRKSGGRLDHHCQIFFKIGAHDALAFNLGTIGNAK